MYTLYIGSPNQTRHLDESTIEKIKQVTGKYFQSYTYIKARGVYEGQEEDTLLISIAKADKTNVYALGEELRSLLRQDGVAVEHNGVYEQLIT